MRVWCGLGLVLLVLAAVPLTHAGQIPVGLPWQEIFIQEYWLKGKPYYAIANIGKDDVVARCFSPDF